MQKILKAARENKLGTFEGDPTRASADFSAKFLQPEERGRYTQRAKRKTSNQQYARYPHKVIIQKRIDKKCSKQVKT